MNTNEDGAAADHDAKKKHSERVERIQSKVNAALWVGLAGAAIYYVDFFNVAFHDERVKRTPLNVCIVCLTINLSLGLYLSVYLPYFEKIRDHKMWDIHCPNVIPTITFCGILTLILGNVAFWPVWGFLTPLLIFLLMMGVLLVGHFIPSW